MTIFQLARKRRLELIAIYLGTRPAYHTRGGDMGAAAYVAAMTREQMVAAIVASRAGKRLLREDG